MQELLGNKFRVILCDPPWDFSVWSAKGIDRSAGKHYKVMNFQDICALPVTNLAEVDCFLFMWTTGPHLPQAFTLMESWGFRYSSIGFSWAKTLRKGDGWHVGLGYTTRHNIELCLLATRGKPKRISKSVRELIVSPVREHSRKPDEVYARIEAFSSGPYLELFARTQRPGWTVWGNEVGKFGNAI